MINVHSFQQYPTSSPSYLQNTADVTGAPILAVGRRLAHGHILSNSNENEATISQNYVYNLIPTAFAEKDIHTCKYERYNSDVCEISLASDGMLQSV